MCEMTDSSPWALAGSVECVCVTEGLTAGRIGDMSRPGDRGLLTAGAHRHTHTRTDHHPNYFTDGRSGDSISLVVCIVRTPPQTIRPLAKDMKDPSKAVLLVPAAITSHS